MTPTHEEIVESVEVEIGLAEDLDQGLPLFHYGPHDIVLRHNARWSDPLEASLLEVATESGLQGQAMSADVMKHTVKTLVVDHLLHLADMGELVGLPSGNWCLKDEIRKLGKANPDWTCPRCGSPLELVSHPTTRPAKRKCPNCPFWVSHDAAERLELATRRKSATAELGVPYVEPDQRKGQDMTAERHAYQSYKRGYQMGAQGLPVLADLGTPAPWSIEAYRRGWEAGHLAYTRAMEAEAGRLGLVGDEKPTDIDTRGLAVISAAVAWWKGHRPVDWSDRDHLHNPTINAHDTEKSEALAAAVGEWVAETGEPST